MIVNKNTIITWILVVVEVILLGILIATGDGRLLIPMMVITVIVCVLPDNEQYK